MRKWHMVFKKVAHAMPKVAHEVAHVLLSKWKFPVPCATLCATLKVAHAKVAHASAHVPHEKAHFLSHVLLYLELWKWHMRKWHMRCRKLHISSTCATYVPLMCYLCATSCATFVLYHVPLSKSGTSSGTSKYVLLFWKVMCYFGWYVLWNSCSHL